MNESTHIVPPPGACVTWEAAAQEMGEIKGDPEIVRRVWEDLDGLAYTYIWQVLLSF